MVGIKIAGRAYALAREWMTGAEDTLTGSRAGLGEAVLDIGGKIQRCVMITRPQPGGIDRDLGVLRTIARERSACLAVGALVARPGIVRDGDGLRPA